MIPNILYYYTVYCTAALYDKFGGYIFADAYKINFQPYIYTAALHIYACCVSNGSRTLGNIAIALPPTHTILSDTIANWKAICILE